MLSQFASFTMHPRSQNPSTFLINNGVQIRQNKSLTLREFIVFDNITYIGGSIILAVSWEQSKIIMINIRTARIIKSINLSNVGEIRILDWQLSLVRTRKKLLFVQDIQLTCSVVKEIEIDQSSYSIYPLFGSKRIVQRQIPPLFALALNISSTIEIYQGAKLICSIKANDSKIQMIWPMQKHRNIIALFYLENKVDIFDWQLNQIVFSIQDIRISNPKKALIMPLHVSQYLIASSNGMSILNIDLQKLEHQPELWSLAFQNVQFISLILVSDKFIIATFLNEYQDYFIYLYDRLKNDIIQSEIPSDFHLTSISHQSFLSTFSNYDRTKLTLWS